MTKWFTVAAALAGLSGCQTVTGVEPDSLTLFGHEEVQVRGTGFSGLAEGYVDVLLGGAHAVDVHIVDDTTIRATPQGSATPGVVDVAVRDTRLFGTVVSKPAAFEWLDTPHPEFRNIVNFGPSLSAGVTNMGYAPPGQIHSIPALVSHQLGSYFPQRIVIEGGIPPMESPHETDLVFVGDGVRECWIPAIERRYVPEPGEICDPVVVALDEIPILDLALVLLDEILEGIISGKGLVGGLFQDVDIDNKNWAIPGEQMTGFTFGSKFPFNYLLDFFNDPFAPLRNGNCSGEPVIKMIADMQDPADLVIGFDWFFDSVLFSNPPLDDLVHQLAFAMLTLSTSEYHQGTPCPAGTNDGTWRVPLVSTDGTLTRTFQPYQGLAETCDAAMQCPGQAPAATATVEALREAIRATGDRKDGYVVDWFSLGLVPPSADVNGNGILDIHPSNPAANELTATVLAGILASDDPSDDPRAVVLGTMPWPSSSPSGNAVGGASDVFAENVNTELVALYAIFQQAAALAGRADNLVLVDAMGQTRDIFEGRRADLTHGIDGDPLTQELYYDYTVDGGGHVTDRRYREYGGVFSLDHLHLSQTMNAVTANEILSALDARFGTGVAPLDLGAVWSADPYDHLRYDATIQCAFTGLACPPGG